MFQLASVVVAIAGVCTWLAISARQSRLRSVFRYLLLTVAISSTTLVVASAALFVLFARESADSPAAAIPLIVAVFCAAVAVPFWLGFVVQARYWSGQQLPGSSKPAE
jgi:putative flippase GtrA